MSRWYEYVVRVAGTDSQTKIAGATGIAQSTLSKWKNGAAEPSPAQAAKFAEAYKANVLEAFVAAGFLTREQAGVTPELAPDLALARDEHLVAELARRLEQRRDDLRTLRNQIVHGYPEASPKFGAEESAAAIARVLVDGALHIQALDLPRVDIAWHSRTDQIKLYFAKLERFSRTEASADSALREAIERYEALDEAGQQAVLREFVTELETLPSDDEDMGLSVAARNEDRERRRMGDDL